MKGILINLCFTIMFCILIESCEHQAKWKSYSLCDNKVEIQFPSEITLIDSSINNTDIGNIPTYSYIYQPSQSNNSELYAFGYSVFNETMVVDVQKLIDLKVDEVMKSTDANLLENTVDEKYGCKGRKIKYSMKNGAYFMYARYYYCDYKLFGISVIISKSNLNEIKVFSFINSFKYRQ